MNTNYELAITHLYPKHMNMYGDIGNVITLTKRCQWRGINVKFQTVNPRENLPHSTDIFFMGGGQDLDQLYISGDFQRHRARLTSEIENGKSFLAVCGAFQLLGKYFTSGDGTQIKGLGILDLTTAAKDQKVKTRSIGDIVVRLNNELGLPKDTILDTIVGFENHSGQTFLGDKLAPLGYVLKGYGNNLKEKIEGCIYKNLICTYMHGSFLPKNPHIADLLILRALKQKYGANVRLPKLDDTEEITAHLAILQRMHI